MKLWAKRVVLSCGALLVGMFAHGLASASAAPVPQPLEGIKVQVNDELIQFPDAQPFLDASGNLQVPVRFISDKLGYEVQWEMDGQQVNVTLQNKQQTISFKSGETTARKNDTPVKLNSASVFSNGRVYVPVRGICDALGVLLQWDNNNRLAILGLDGKYHAPAWYAPEVSHAIDIKATAYTASPEENGGYGPVDYFGNPLELGTIAVDPAVIPLGSTVYVTGYNFDSLPKGGMMAKAVDTGGAIKGNRIDIFIPTSPDKADKFGFQNVKVYVLK